MTSKFLAGLCAALILLPLPALAAEEVAAVPAPRPVVQQTPSAAPDYSGLVDRLTALGMEAGSARRLAETGGDRVAQLLAQGTEGENALLRLALPYARPDRLDRYAAYSASRPDLPQEQVVLEVNMDRDKTPYVNPTPVSDPGSLSVLVNKHHNLSSGYSPSLEGLGSGYGKGSLRPVAARAFRSMADAAREEGITLVSVSAYRSYSTQRKLYRSYLGQYSQATTDTFSARPGYSEHQTGLALDINTASTSDHFENTADYRWLRENCARFGFILRYPQGKEHITGYRFEPWHYRYVGTEAAQTCMSRGWTYEEYLARRTAGVTLSPTALTLDGETLPESAAQRRSDGWYISPLGLAQAMGWTVEEEPVVSFRYRHRSYQFLWGYTSLCNGLLLRHSAPPLEENGTLWLPLEDMADAMDWTVTQGLEGIRVTS